MSASSSVPRMLIDTYADTVVPECNVVLVPLETHMQFLSRGNDVVEVRENRVALPLGYSHNLCDKARVEEQCLPASDGVRANEWVLGGHGVATNSPT